LRLRDSESDAAPRRPPLLPPARLADAAVALGLLGGRDLFESDMDGLVASAGACVHALSPAQAVDVARGLALASHLPPAGLVAALEARAAAGTTRHKASPPPSSLSRATIAAAVWAFASLAHPPDTLLAACDFGAAVAPRLGPRPAAAAAWGLAVSGRGGGREAAALAVRLTGLGADQLTARTGRRGLRQVHWAALAARLLGEEEGGDGGGLATPLASSSPAALAWAASDGHPDSLTDAAAAGAAADARRGATRSSAVQEAVLRAMASLLGRGVVRAEATCPLTGLVVDGLLPADRLAEGWAGPPRGVAVEVDGPTHFHRGKAACAAAACDSLPGAAGGRRPTPPTALKRRLLTAAGWAVVSIDVEAWGRLGSGEAEASFVRGVLSEIGACR
jgi:hypothetical protein